MSGPPGGLRLLLCRSSADLRTIHATAAAEGSLISAANTLCDKPVSEPVGADQPRNTIACLECVMTAALIILRAREIERRR